MQVQEQENGGIREGKQRTRMADNKRKIRVTSPGGRNPHPTGWTAFCKSVDETMIPCTGYASFRCQRCNKPTCSGCARESYDTETGDEQIICGTCWEAL